MHRKQITIHYKNVYILNIIKLYVCSELDGEKNTKIIIQLRIEEK